MTTDEKNYNFKVWDRIQNRYLSDRQMDREGFFLHYYNELMTYSFSEDLNKRGITFPSVRYELHFNPEFIKNAKVYK